MAIELWFHDGDPVCIHTLASAAHQIVHDLNRQNKGTELLFDLTFFKTEKQKKEFVAQIRKPSNFFKHADRGARAKDTIVFDPDLNVHMIMFATFAIQYLGKKLTSEEMAFQLWHIIRKPELLTDAGEALFKKSYGVDQTEGVRRVPKRQFLETCRSVVREKAS